MTGAQVADGEASSRWIGSGSSQERTRGVLRDKQSSREVDSRFEAKWSVPWLEPPEASVSKTPGAAGRVARTFDLVKLTYGRLPSGREAQKG